MHIEFASAGRIVLGAGAIREVGSIAAGLGRRALVVTGRDPSRAHAALDGLGAADVAVGWAPIDGEPTTDGVAAVAERARREGVDLVIGFGGGSAIDAAKAVAGLCANAGDLFDYLEIIGRAQPLGHPALPCIAIPTTAGAGAEVTRNAVLLSPAHGLKVSLRSPHLLPRVALIDPELTHSLPPDATASTGLDALTQLIEPFVSVRSNPMTDGFCREGIPRAVRSLAAAVRDGANRDAREDLAVASLFGGLALANAGLGAVHGFAAPIGGMFRAPHGAVCAALLPHATAVNVRALRERAPGSPALARYGEVARIVTGDADARPEDAASWLARFVASLQIPPLRTHGLTDRDTDAIVKAAAGASSMRGNPITLTDSELSHILRAAL